MFDPRERHEWDRKVGEVQTKRMRIHVMSFYGAIREGEA